MAAKRIPEKNLKKDLKDVYYEKFYTLLDYKVDSEGARVFVTKDLMEGVFVGCPVHL